MRTTVRLSDELLARSKQEARKRGETLTSLLERGLRLAVSGSHKRARAARVTLPTSKATGGVLPDVNVLVYAFRRDSTRHKEYRAWLQAVVDGPNAYGVSSQVLASVLRICTHPKIYRRPSTVAETLPFCDA